jgi:serine/threonine protein phosphatase PrpC
MSRYKAFCTTAKGSSHIKNNKECQDASNAVEKFLSTTDSVEGKSWIVKLKSGLESLSGAYKNSITIAVVADGHGDENCFRSAKGAEFAVNCAIQSIYEFANSIEAQLGNKKAAFKDFDTKIRQLIKHIIKKWHEEVEKDYTLNPFRAEELVQADDKHRKRYEEGNSLNKAYGTTLIAAAITKDYWLGIHIGDGRLTALYPNGSYDQPVPWDEKCYLNVTTSLCDNDSFENTRFYFSLNSEKAMPIAVFLCTDGLDDNYPVEDNDKYLFELYRTIALTFDEDGYDSTCNQIIELAKSFAVNGKGDDTSIAGFIDVDRIKQFAPLWRKFIKMEKDEKAITLIREKEEIEKKNNPKINRFARLFNNRKGNL